MNLYREKDLNHTLWVEKYRPTTLDNIIINDDIKAKIYHYIEGNDPPHLLLFSKIGGTGKTTLAQILIRNLDCECLELHADDKNFAKRAKAFSMQVSFNPLKIIYLDECDELKPVQQQSIRKTIEKYSKMTRFIFTCNEIKKLIQPLRSRFQRIEIKPPTERAVYFYIKDILKKEQVKYDNDVVENYISMYFPSVRDIINQIQFSVTDNLLMKEM